MELVVMVDACVALLQAVSLLLNPYFGYTRGTVASVPRVCQSRLKLSRTSCPALALTAY
ncbi:hypothetical protein KIF59_04815 [Enterobacter cloacae subsp. cloacae]|nr:hypothetical protein [Enterobacter cloacae subsp. cloacae]